LQAKKHLRILLLLLATTLCLFLLASITDRLLRAARRAAVFDNALCAAAEFGVPPAMVLAVIETESDFKPDARSPAGAIGLMQLMPDTFRYLRDEKLLEDLPDEAIWEPKTNVRYGACYLAYLFDRFGDWRVALAAYNAGEGRVAAWLADPRYGTGTALLNIPFPETENYLAVTLSRYRRYSKKYKFKEFCHERTGASGKAVLQKAECI